MQKIHIKRGVPRLTLKSRLNYFTNYNTYNYNHNYRTLIDTETHHDNRTDMDLLTSTTKSPLFPNSTFICCNVQVQVHSGENYVGFDKKSLAKMWEIIEQDTQKIRKRLLL